MTEQPSTWHYGLVARWWAEFNVSDPNDEDLAYFRSAVERYGQPALDLACGTGRLLVPLLVAGLDVDGCDVSSDMVELCREYAAREGHSPLLYVQPMHALDLPCLYKTIFICGGFGLGGRRSHDAETLRRCYHHLEPGGALVFDHHLPYEYAERWQSWLPEHTRQPPQEWPETGTRARADNGDEFELRTRLVELDPLEQRLTAQIRVSLTRDGHVVAREEHSLQECLYFRNEVLQLLAQAGFTDVSVYAGYTERTPSFEDGLITFVAVKPA
ncbi:MAG: class I SAM-dependent methyltransferase [Chloroflexota bacterium]